MAGVGHNYYPDLFLYLFFGEKLVSNFSFQIIRAHAQPNSQLKLPVGNVILED
jgi:hypothetical protein